MLAVVQVEPNTFADLQEACQGTVASVVLEVVAYAEDQTLVVVVGIAQVAKGTQVVAEDLVAFVPAVEAVQVAQVFDQVEVEIRAGQVAQVVEAVPVDSFALVEVVVLVVQAFGQAVGAIQVGSFVQAVQAFQAD